MLQSIRDKTQGWVAGIIISLLILSFALWGIHSYLVSGSVNDVVAKVNGVKITQGQLSTVYERLRRQLEVQNASSDVLGTATADLKREALQSLVNLEVLKQASFNQKYRISALQVEDYLENMPDFKVNGQFSVSRFQQILNAMLFTTRDFLELVRTTLLIDQPRLGIIFSSFSLPDEVAHSIGLINQEREILYATLPLSLFAQPPIVVSQEKVLAYYKQHIALFQKPEQVSVEYVLLSANDIRGKMHPAEDVLKKYYEDNMDAFSLPAKWTFSTLLVPVANDAKSEDVQKAENEANAIYQKVEQGKAFSLLAEEYSLSKQSLSQYDGVALNAAPVDVQSVLLTATAPGSVVKPVKTNEGFLIIKVLDYKQAERQPFEKVREQVKNAVVALKSQEEFADLKEKLANITYEHPDSLKPAAEALGLPVRVSGLFSRDQSSESALLSARQDSAQESAAAKEKGDQNSATSSEKGSQAALASKEKSDQTNGAALSEKSHQAISASGEEGDQAAVAAKEKDDQAVSVSGEKANGNVSTSKESASQDISTSLKVREAAFSSDVLNALNNSDVIPINADSVVVLRIKSHSPAMSLPLSDVQNQIVEKLKVSEMEARASVVTQEILKKLQSAASEEDVAKQYHFTWVHAGFMSRHSTKVDSAILNLAFDLPKSEKGNAYAVAKIPTGYAVVGVKSIQNGTLARPDDYDAFAAQVQNAQGLLEYELYKQSLMKQANIVIDNPQGGV